MVLDKLLGIGFALSLPFVLLPSFATSQDNAGASLPATLNSNSGIELTVVDSTGAVIPEAHILLKFDEHIAAQGSTTLYGQYQFRGLTPGIYKVVVGHPGFRDSSQSVTISAQKVTFKKVTLQIAEKRVLVSNPGPFLPVSTAATPSLPLPEQARQQLLALENHWLKVEDNPDELESILAPDFLHVVGAGIITKDEQLSFMRKHPASKQNSEKYFENMHVRVYGNVGIVNGVVVAKEDGATRRTLFTDVFAYREGKWQAVGAQELPLPETK